MILMRFIIKKSPLLLFILLLIVLTSRIMLAHSYIHNPAVHIQQDHYADYANAIKRNALTTSFSKSDQGLFPGYPIIIWLFSFIVSNTIVAGIIISIISSCAVTWLLWSIFKSTIPAIFSLFFTPVWIKEGAKVATEPIFVALSLLAVYCSLRKKDIITGILVGAAFIIRPIGITLLITFIVLVRGDVRRTSKIVLGFFIPVVILFLFNYFEFGRTGILEQFSNQSRYGGIRLGAIQMIIDIYRTIDWKEYRIFVSGIFYIFINFGALALLFKFRNESPLNKLMLTWLSLSLLFIFGPCPVTLIDDFGRYTLAGLPAVLFSAEIIFSHYFFHHNLQPNNKHVSSKP